MVSSMSRRGNVHDNAVVESFFQLLKRERIRRQVYATRSDARADVFNYIEMIYNLKRRHCTAGGTSPVEFERRYSQRLKSVSGIRVDSSECFAFLGLREQWPRCVWWADEPFLRGEIRAKKA